MKTATSRFLLGVFDRNDAANSAGDDIARPVQRVSKSEIRALFSDVFEESGAERLQRAANKMKDAA